LEDVLVLLNKVFTKFLEKLGVPLNDGFLFLATLPLHFIVLFLEPVEDGFELFFV
jgi:hypothetical protein